MVDTSQSRLQFFDVLMFVSTPCQHCEVMHNKNGYHSHPGITTLRHDEMSLTVNEIYSSFLLSSSVITTLYVTCHILILMHV